MPRNDSPGSEGIDLGKVFAPIFFGFVFALILSGITILQAYIYFPSTDRKVIQITAAVMIAFDLASTALVTQSVYYYLIPNYGSLVPLGSFTAELAADCLLSTVMTFISQLYFVVQLKTVAKNSIVNWIATVVVFITAVGAFVGGIGCTIVMFIHDSSILSTRSIHLNIFFGLAKGFGALSDIVATTAMCLLLASSKTGIKETNSMLRSLMHFVMERGALVTLIQTLLLITYYTCPNRLIWLFFHINVTKLYANTFFAMLNGRQSLKKQGTIIQPSTFSAHSFRDISRNDKRILTRSVHISDNSNEQLDFTDPKGQRESYGMPEMPTVTKTVLVAEL